MYWARTIGAARSVSAAVANDNLRRLRVSLHALQAGHSGSFRTPVSYLESEGWVAFAEGRNDAAITYLRRAVARENAEGGDSVTMPAREMLADLLAELHRPQDALKAYGASLRVAPNRFDSLLGAARSADALGANAQAREYYRRLIALAGPTADRSEIALARAYVENEARRD